MIIFFWLTGCDKKDPLSPVQEKYIRLEPQRSVVPARMQFQKNRVYHFKLSFDSNYLSGDGLEVKSFFISGPDTVRMELYDDGVSDDSLRNDIAASNNVWSGGINGNDFPFEGEWTLHTVSFIDHIPLTHHEPFGGILVKYNTPPEITSITGIAEGDTLISGFSTRSVSAAITDPDNDASGYNDNQTIKLEIRNRDNIPKDLYFQRTDPLGIMTFSLDSTLASGLKTNNRYKLTFIATDLYGEKDSLSLDYIRIENTPPLIVKVTSPDSIYTGEDGIFWIRSKINDPQGHLSSQDIEKVEIVLNGNPYILLDDGNFGSSGDDIKDDGIYSIGFSFNAGTSGTYGFSINAYDKAGNQSVPYVSSITLVPEFKKLSGNNYEIIHNYTDPFTAD